MKQSKKAIACADGGKIPRMPGKGAQHEMLPHRGAMNQLTKGDPMQRTMGQYAKKTPGVGDQPPGMGGGMFPFMGR